MENEDKGYTIPFSHERVVDAIQYQASWMRPGPVKGMSERLIVSHYENNYGGAVKRLNLIEEKLAELDFESAACPLINGLKREQLIR